MNFLFEVERGAVADLAMALAFEECIAEDNLRAWSLGMRLAVESVFSGAFSFLKPA